MAKNLESKCPLMKDDGKCGHPYREKYIFLDCPDDFLTCGLYRAHCDIERYEKARAKVEQE